ncbi:MAG: Fic family protein [Rhodospirillaceae bacterium]|nr:Fic family protein [Rhodospirillaceae bacterium]
MIDPYVLKNGILKNKLNITNEQKLVKAEAALTSDRLAEIEIKGSKGSFDFERLKATHYYIFQDIYDWAGQPRTIGISKGNSNFTPSYLIDHKIESLFSRLEKDNFLKNLKPKEFADKASEFFTELNQIHPFREGNGRTQRAFTEALAKQAGYNLAFDISTKERMIDISIRSHQGDLGGMNRLFSEMIDPEKVEMMRKALGFLSQSTIPWNDIYIATTEPGQAYHGSFVGQAGQDFMMRTNQKKIIIGHIKEFQKIPERGETINFTSQFQTTLQNKLSEKNYSATAQEYGLTGEKAAEFSRRMQQRFPEKSVNQSRNLDKDQDVER